MSVNTSTEAFSAVRPVAGQGTIASIPEFQSCLQFLTPAERDFVASNVYLRTFHKGVHLLREGEIPRSCYFVFRGLVRQYCLVDGEEKTTNFYQENEPLDTLMSSRQVPSRYNLECLEDSTLTIVSHTAQAEMYRLFPRLESMSRVDTERRLGEQQDVMLDYMITTPEERYLNLIATRPALVSRVPQYQLASYIGVKPESLSRIRRRIAKRQAKPLA